MSMIMVDYGKCKCSWLEKSITCTFMLFMLNLKRLGLMIDYDIDTPRA